MKENKMTKEYKPYAILYVNNEEKFSVSSGVNYRTSYLEKLGDIIDNSKNTLFARFNLNDEQDNIIWSEDFRSLVFQPFSEFQEKANSLVAKLKSAEAEEEK